MALLDDVRACLHVSSNKTDAEIQIWIDAALANMRSCGVKEELLQPKSLGAMAKAAVVMYVKANYGYDNSEAPRFQQAYDSTVISLLNSKANEYLFPEEE
jgi:hypothetical protein